MLPNGGHLEVKPGSGFYQYKDGKPVKEESAKPPGDMEGMQNRLIGRPLADAAVACLDEAVVDAAEILDAAIIFGTVFAPVRGRALHYLEQQKQQAK